MNEPSPEQRCPKCRRWLPATPAFFHQKKGVLNAACILCERLAQGERKRWKRRVA